MSLINDALKRASEAQAQAAQRPRGPKGIDDLPAPMTPTATRERPTWLPAAGIALLIVLLLGASGYFFMQWWKERQAWQPYATEDIDENGFPRTNKPVAKVESPRPAPVSTNKSSAPPIPAATNPPVSTNLPAGTNVAVVPPVGPAKTNPPVAVTVTNPPAVIKLPDPPVPKTTNPVLVVATTNPPTPPVTPPTPPKGETNVASVTPPPVKPIPPIAPPDTTKEGDGPTNKVPAIEFPDLKLQGISRRKNKTYAILNGKTLTAGDRIEGVMLLKIDSDSVTVEKGGARRELFLLR